MFCSFCSTDAVTIEFFSSPVIVIPLSALYGAALLVLADVLGRVLGSPGELEVGIVTAVLGAPVFILVAKKAKVRSL